MPDDIKLQKLFSAVVEAELKRIIREAIEEHYIHNLAHQQ